MRAPLALLPLVLLASAMARAQEGDAGADEGEAPLELPDALPPLDDTLVDEAPPSPLRFFAQARLRGELDESRDFSRADDASVGVALTGRVGVDAVLDGARLLVVLGDGARLGQAPTTPALVKRPVLPVLFAAELALDVELFGMPAAVSLGRMPVVVGDGRLVGAEGFDARGRTLDGARAVLRGDVVDASMGAFWLTPGEDETAAEASGSGFGFVELAVRDRELWLLHVDLDIAGLIHRDATLGLTIPTGSVRLGGRMGLEAWELGARAGVDLQAPLVDGDELFRAAGQSTRALGGVRVAPRLSSWLPRAPDPFLELSGEITTGDVVGGRVLHAPAPTQHAVLGLLDLVAADNTWSSALTVGARASRGLMGDITGRLIGIVDRTAPLLDVAGKPVAQRVGNGLAVVELSARLELPLTRDLALGAAYGVALPGSALVGDQPAQRLLVTLRATATSDGDPEGLPPLPLQ